MANSRLEKIGTIYARTQGLIQSRALNYNDRPVWFDLYEIFPPKDEPKYDHPVPNMQIREIFYEEDSIRVKLPKHLGKLGAVNLLNQNTQSLSQKFIKTYKKINDQYGLNAQDTQKILDEAIGMLKKEGQGQCTNDKENYGMLAGGEPKKAEEFHETSSSDGTTTAINVKSLFKD